MSGFRFFVPDISVKEVLEKIDSATDEKPFIYLMVRWFNSRIDLASNTWEEVSRN